MTNFDSVLGTLVVLGVSVCVALFAAALGIFRSGRISSVYIVGCGLWIVVVGHTFSKLVNFECVGLC